MTPTDGLTPFPGEIGSTITLDVGSAQPKVEEPFRVDDLCSFPPFGYQFRVTRVEWPRVTFTRIS